MSQSTQLHDDFERGIDDIKIEDFILVKYQIGTKPAKHYVGQVSEIRGIKYDVAYLIRYQGSESKFVFPDFCCCQFNSQVTNSLETGKA